VIVVIDTNVVVSATFWSAGESRRCFFLLAKRMFKLAVTEAILGEYRDVAERIRQKQFPQKDPQPFLDWISEKAIWHEPASVGKQRSRDLEDDIFIACALASAAKIIVSKDQDLLVLEKPFGIEILTPRQFLARFK
jgi:putative PIN family toxin of toxin-antitoxin system